MREYFFSDKARRDMRDIWLYIAEDNVDAADRMCEEIEEAGEVIARHPMIGHVRPELTDQPVRFWLVGPYLMVYRPETDPVEIVRVLHGRRNIRAILG